MKVRNPPPFYPAIPSKEKKPRAYQLHVFHIFNIDQLIHDGVDSQACR